MPSGYSAARFERVFAGTGLAGLGQAFCRAEKTYGINGVILAAICAHAVSYTHLDVYKRQDLDGG